MDMLNSPDNKYCASNNARVSHRIFSFTNDTIKAVLKIIWVVHHVVPISTTYKLQEHEICDTSCEWNFVILMLCDFMQFG